MAAERLGSVPVIGPRGVEQLQEWGAQQGLSIEIFSVRPRLYVVGSSEESNLTEAELNRPFPSYGAVATVSSLDAIEVGTSMVAPPDWLKDHSTVFWGRTEELAIRRAVHRYQEKYPRTTIDSSSLPSNVVPLPLRATA